MYAKEVIKKALGSMVTRYGDPLSSVTIETLYLREDKFCETTGAAGAAAVVPPREFGCGTRKPSNEPSSFAIPFRQVLLRAPNLIPLY